MGTRKSTTEKRSKMLEDIRKDCLSRKLAPGEAAPTVRTLQSRYGLSSRVVQEELRKLVGEGLLVNRPRVGMFVAETTPRDPSTFLITVPRVADSYPWSEMLRRVQNGFEEHISKLGGATQVIEVPLAADRPAGMLPSVSGIFAAGAKNAGELRGVVPDDVPRVRWLTAPLANHHPELDTVAPDHVGAGRRATEHLMALGHRRIGFLGNHQHTGMSPQTNHWSALVEAGWRESIADHIADPSELSFLVDNPTDDPDTQTELAHASARKLVTRRDITAVICANAAAASGLVDALNEASVTPDAWPRIVTTGDTSASTTDFATSVRIPHEQLGLEAARLLWERAHAHYRGQGRHMIVPMPIVRRADDPQWIRLAGTRT